MSNRTIEASSVYIYALCEQKRTEIVVRYIGRACYPHARRGEHMKDALEFGGSPKKEWIRRLRQKGKTPLLVILDRVPREEEEQAERRWIAHFKSIGCDLTNSR